MEKSMKGMEEWKNGQGTWNNPDGRKYVGKLQGWEKDMERELSGLTLMVGIM